MNNIILKTECGLRVWSFSRNCCDSRALGLIRLGWWQWQGIAGRLTNPEPIQAKNQDYVLAHPNIHPICDLLGHGVGGSILGTQGCRIFMTQGNNRMSRKISSETIDDAAETRGLEQHQWSFSINIVKIYGWKRGLLSNSLLHYSFNDGISSFFLSPLFFS